MRAERSDGRRPASAMGRGIVLGVALLLAAGAPLGCGPAEEDSPARSTGETRQFHVNWPLDDPGKARPPAKYLLKGELHVRPEGLGTPDARLVISLTLTRPDDDDTRILWNTQTLFPEYGWIHRLRVWDPRREWLWPNLAYLFRLHGRDRHERYGGWDPGKKVDNDFGAVLIRKYGAAGTASPDSPLVSANWQTPGARETNKYTVVHFVKSDDLTVHLAGEGGPSRGVLGVWFVYGDFMKAPVPKGWPKAKEFAGGTVAYFHVAWERRPGKPLGLRITRKVPPPTGFDWRKWVGRKSEAAKPVGKSKLTDA